MALLLGLNADVGEGFPHDAELLQIITQANVACGFHAGDDATMRAICDQAVEREVAVGAQVSYRDREGFGRREMEVDHDALVGDLTEQVEALSAAAMAAGTSVGYLKPHGALYNRVVWDEVQARAVSEVCVRSGLPLLCLPGSVALRQARERSGAVLREFFADRAYDARGRLVPRGTEGAVISDPALVAERVSRLLATGTVVSIGGDALDVEADSVCVHGDTPGAVALAEAARGALSGGAP